MIRLRIADLLAARGWTTRQLSQQTGIYYNTAMSLVRGSVAGIKFDTLSHVCEALHCTPGDVLEYIPDTDVGRESTSRRPAEKKPRPAPAPKPKPAKVKKKGS